MMHSQGHRDDFVKCDVPMSDQEGSAWMERLAEGFCQQLTKVFEEGLSSSDVHFNLRTVNKISTQ